MGNAAQIAFTAAVDIPADVYLCTFQAATGAANEDSSEEYTPDIRQAERIQIQAGPEPSYAVVSIPMKSYAVKDEKAFTVAFSKTGPLGKIKLRSRATIHHSCRGKSTAILAGSVVDISHDAAVDAAVVTVVDDRWLLDKIMVFGQMQYDPVVAEEKAVGVFERSRADALVASGGNVAFAAAVGASVAMAAMRAQEKFVAAEPCIFNAMGWPNCVDAPSGPRFAPSLRYGYGMRDIDEPAAGKAIRRARSWTITDAIEYLRAAHYGGASSRASSPINYGNPFTPFSIIWPKNLGAMLTVADTKKNQGGNRALNNYSAEGKTLLAVLAELARKAGPFDLFIQPAGGG